MIIILEGPDGSGKTTLARQLAQRYELQYHHEGPPPPNVSALEHYGYILDQARGQDYVFDRFALGERVYGPVIRGVDGLGEDGWHVFNRLMTAVGAIHVLCLPDYETCFNAWKERKGELFTESNKFAETYMRYELLRDEVEFIVYDYTEPNALTWLYSSLETCVDRTTVLPAGLVGHPLARVLFVGDRGGDPMNKADLPFFATHRSSRFLNEALALAGIEERDIAFMNAYRNSTQSAAEPQQFARTIALGRAAVTFCNTHKIEHQRVPHPAYWRRFHHHDIEQYAQLLRKACAE